MNDKTVSMRFENKVTGEKKLEKYAETLQKIQAFSNGVNKDTLNQISSAGGSLNSIASSAKTAKASLIGAFSIEGIKAFVAGVKKAAEAIGKFTQKSAEYTENLNLYQVAFNGAYQEADKFVNKLNEMYGLDESWLVRTTGIFKQLSNAMGLSVEQGTKFSTLLTQMSVDISSLYNIDIDKASSVLQSAIAGQTKPIRGSTGADITQATLQSTLSNLNIDAYVSDLSYAEKRLLIIISLTQQLQQATNDFGKTIESPANQTRILSEQWERLSRALGNLFLPAVSGVLPYLNAILMVLTEIINVIASFLGFNIEDFDYGVAAIADTFDDLDESIGGAVSGVGELKQKLLGLRGFDKLNNLTTPKSGGAGGAGGVGGGTGINPKLMEAFNKAFDAYNQKLKNVQMKANKIRDFIMEALGFTKEIDEVTGDISFKYEGIFNKAKKGGILSNILADIAEALYNILGPLNGLPWVMDYNIKFLKNAKNALSKFNEDADKLSNVSKKAKKNLEPVQKAFENLKTTISTVSYDGLAITEEEKQKIIDSINDVTKALKESLQKYVDEQIKNLNYLYKETGVITKEEYDKRLKDLETFQNNSLDTIEKEGEHLKQTYSTIYDENGNIIMENYAKYLDELEKYENDSYKRFTMGETDKITFQNELDEKSFKDKVTYYSNLMQQYAKDRDNAIKKAKEKRDETIKAAEETYGKQSEEYQKIADKAEETYLSEVETATTKYNEIYDEFEKSQENIADYLDKDTGGVKRKFSSFFTDIKNMFSGGMKLKVNWETNLTSIQQALVKALKLPGWPKLAFTHYAQGGLPPVGQLFVANEKGPELVGNIGGQSFVANQNQMLDILDRKISSSGGMKNATFIIQVGSKEVAREVLTNLQDMAKSSGKPIKIGG